jgi:hypothetical protein
MEISSKLKGLGAQSLKVKGSCFKRSKFEVVEARIRDYGIRIKPLSWFWFFSIAA